MNNAPNEKRGRNRHPGAEILLHLATHGETSQVDLADVVPKRTVQYLIPKLKNANLIKITDRRIRDSESVGAYSNFWSLTFEGILTVVRSGLNDSDLESLISHYSNTNLVFKKWGFISKNSELKDIIKNHFGLIEYHRRDLWSLDKTLDNGIIKYDHPGEAETWENFYLKMFYQEVLLINEVLNGILLMPGVMFHGKPWGKTGVHDPLEYLLTDPDFRQIFNRFFEEEEVKYSVVQQMRAQYKIVKP